MSGRNKFFECIAHLGRGFHGGDARGLQGGVFFCGGAFATGDNGAGVTHAFALGRGNTCDVGDHWFCNVVFNELGRLFFGGTADFTDHEYGLGLRVLFKQSQTIDEGGPGQGVAADTNTGALPEAQVGGLFYGFVGQGAGTGYHTHLACLVNRPRHNADLAFTRRDDARAIGPD